MEIVGKVKLGESQYCQPAYYRRLLGWRSYGLPVWIVWIGAMAFVVSTSSGEPRPTPWVAPALVGLSVLMLGWIASQRDVLVRAWRRRGAPEHHAVSYAVQAEGLRIRSSGIDSLLSWSVITDICPGNKRWLVIVHEGTYFLMKDMFADDAEERVFLAACLGRLSEPARARSNEAAAFVGKA